MMAPSTMLSGGTDSTSIAETRYPLPAGFSSIALTELEPMSSPTRLLALRNSTLRCLQTQTSLAIRIPEVPGFADPTKSAVNAGNGYSGQLGVQLSTYNFATGLQLRLLCSCVKVACNCPCQLGLSEAVPGHNRV